MTRVSSVGKTKIGLVQFPGSNCDMDCFDALKRHFGLDVEPIWHTETELPPLDGLILPGGFSYGDYLRSGALASHSPILPGVRAYAARGGAVMGICNGFQILTESHMLPGVLLRNESRSFVCRFTSLAVAPGGSLYHERLRDSVYQIPVAHGEGRYFIDPTGLAKLEDKGQILFHYVDQDGRTSSEANPNGSVANIAGIISEDGKIMGMMPHPERATDKELGGSEDGRAILEAFLTVAAG